MRSKPDMEREYERAELDELHAEPWQIDLLGLNPSYPHWGPYEDYMCGRGDGWGSPLHYDSWPEFGIELDELNECVNFYFQVVRAAKNCDACDRTGLNPETKQIEDDFYDFAKMGRRWCDDVTQDEVNALVEAGRLRRFNSETRKWESVPRTAAEVNAANRRGGLGDLNHDAINRYVLVRARAQRLGVYGRCKHCNGKGYVHTADRAHVNLVLWILHPRKGAGRGVEIKNILQDDLPAVFEWLKTAADRNAARFAAVADVAGGAP